MMALMYVLHIFKQNKNMLENIRTYILIIFNMLYITRIYYYYIKLIKYIL